MEQRWFSDYESPHSARQGLRAEASFLESLRLSIKEKVVFNKALWVCIVAVHRAGHVLRTLAVTKSN